MEVGLEQGIFGLLIDLAELDDRRDEAHAIEARIAQADHRHAPKREAPVGRLGLKVLRGLDQELS